MKQFHPLIFLFLLTVLSTAGYSQNNSSLKDGLLQEEWSNVEREYKLRIQVMHELQEYLAKKKSHKDLSIKIQEELGKLEEKQKDLNNALLEDRKLIASMQNSLTPLVEQWLSKDLANAKDLEKDADYRRIRMVAKGMKTRIAIAVNNYNKAAHKLNRSDLVLEGAENFPIPQVKF